MSELRDLTTGRDEPLSRAQAAIDRALTESRNPGQQLVAAKCKALLAGYDSRWKRAGYQPLAVEKMLTADLVNVDTNRISRTFKTAGKLDVVCAYQNHRVVFDAKTTSQDITDPDSPYWRQLAVEGQVSHYMLLEWLHGSKADYAVWDVVRKPSIAPKKLTKAERASVLSTHSYFNAAVDRDDLEALTTEERETPQLYQARLTNDCIYERPHYYFQRRTVPRIDADLMEYAREQWKHGQEILHARQTNRHARNSGACLLYGTPCKFLGICSGHDSPDSDKWRRKESVHSELPELPGDGRNVLTNSRIRCFQTCRRKHYYEFEMGIERNNEEQSESLFFGTVWHKGVEAWWNAQITRELEAVS